MQPDEIELIYELSPMQQAMLFHSLYAPGSGVYALQMSLRLTGRLDAAAFERAWQRVVDRHAILRTAFFWEDLEKPLQVVLRHVTLEVERRSLRGLDPGAQRERLDAWLEADRERGFEMTEAPLMRLALFDLEPGVHQLVWSLHHLLVDGWSQARLLQELFACYAAFSAGREPHLERAGSFRDYIAWLQRQDLGQAEAFWRESLAGFTAPTPLAGAGGPGAGETRRRSRRLPAETTGALRELGRRRRLTLNTLVQGAWGLLLAQAAGREDVVFGTTVAGRPAELPGVESIVGPFINTLPVRVEVAPESRLGGWLADLQRRQVEARRHEHAPLVEVQRWSELPAGAPLFDHLLVFENVALPAERQVSDLAIEEESAATLTNYPLNLVVLPGTELELSVLYDASRFEPGAVARILERLAVLLTAIAEDRDQPLRELPLLLPAERHQLLVEWNDAASAYPRDAGLAELFEAVARDRADAPAVISGDEVWTWRRLDEAASRLARRLRDAGAGPEVAVGIAMERSPQLIVGLLAILKAGGAYVPLDPSYPDDRLAFMLADAGGRLVLVDAGTRERMAALPTPLTLLSLESLESLSPLPPVRVPAESLGLVLYTSGSTGRPKGVALPQRGVVRLVRETNYLRLGPADRMAHAANISFDTATMEIWGALLNGAALVVISREEVLSPAALAARLRRHEVTDLLLTTSLFNQMAREEPAALSRLRTVMFGGEAADPVAVALAQRQGSKRLLNLYGPTETTTLATWHRVEELPAGAAAVPIGRPVASSTAYVLDRRQTLVPPGVTGELYAGGDGLARGYLNRPDLTAERFLPHPWGGLQGGERLYRTGDLVRQRPDGTIEFLGRTDDQVKIRGFRIEPKEIEVVLGGHPLVRDCVVVPRQSVLVAYVVARRPDPPTDPAEPAGQSDAKALSAQLRAWLAERLPPFMVPTAWVLLDALPLTPNGKLDRRALPAPEPGGTAAEGAAPSDPVEETLAEIWAEVLGLDRVGVHDDFFALGGHSLLVTRTMSRIRAAFGVELPFRTLFESPTVAGLARVVRESRDLPAAPPVPRDGRELPLSFAQQRLWVIDQLDPGDPAYNIPFAVRLAGEVSPALLERIFAEIVRRHEVLRTTFDARDGQPVQIVAPDQRAELSMLDLSALPAAGREETALAAAREMAGRSFDLRRGPLLRLALMRLEEREHLLLMTLHHIVSDGWSMGVLLREIAALAPAFAAGLPSPLPELPLQYADFAAWQRSWLDGEVLAGQLAWWQRELEGAPRELSLPTDRPRAPLQGHDGALVPVTLPAGLIDLLRQLARTEGATPFMLLAAAFQTLLHRVSRQDDVLLGTPVANRGRLETESLIGFFVNTLVLRGRLGSAPTFRALLGQTRESVLGAFEHRDLPFERLVEELVPERNLAVAPLFQVLFSLQTAAAPVSLPSLTLAPVVVYSGQTQLDLSLELIDSGDAVHGLLELRRALFDRVTGQRLAESFAHLLAGALAEPDRRIAELPLLGEGERHQLLREWPHGEPLPPGPPSILTLFARRAALAPDAPAVSLDGRSLTYRELDRRSTRLAQRLRGLGVGPETPVAVPAGRSPELIVAFLGILKAGGAYVPVDPAYPEERRAFMLADSGALMLPPEDPHPRPLSPGRGAGGEGLQDGQLAYVLYTSGSTGRPKGVMVSHGALARYVEAVQPFYAIGPGDRVLQFCSTSFDTSLEEIVICLTSGAELVLRTDAMLGSAEVFLGACRAHRVTVLSLPTAFWHEIAADLESGGLTPPPDLRLVILGGERALPERVAAWRRWAPERPRLLNTYGVTESTIVSTAADLTRRSASEARGEVPAGRAVPATDLHLLDPEMAPVPIGITGEVMIGGALLARGYLGRPDLTAERFVPHPFAPEPGARLYRTGDLARAFHDGTLEILGRGDRQIKIRGYRIETDEIEAALRSHPAVRDGVVVARESILAAYVVLHPKSEIQNPKSTLRAWLSHRLPAYMIPAAWVLLEALPLTPNGKLDRRALPAPEPAAQDLEGFTAPSDPTEELIARIWTEVLGRERIGIHDDFFSLGGHSLRAAQVVSRIRTVLGVEIPLRQLFEHPTVAELARPVRAALRQSHDRIARAPRSGNLPLSFAQQRLWLLDQLEPGSPAYNIPSAVRLTGAVSVPLLERIFAEVVRRHEALRTTFAPHHGTPVQVIAEPAPPALPLIDLSLLPDPAAQALRLAGDEARWSFDLQRGPLLRLLLVRLAAGEHVLLLTMHHIISDGWSMGVLLRELARLHEAYSRSLPSPLPELPVQYADFAIWQRSWLQGEVLAGQLAVWTRRLAGAPHLLDLPTDRPRPAVRSQRGAMLTATLPPALSGAVRTLCRREGVTPFMVFLAAWSALLGRHAGQDDVLVGSPIAGRNRQETEDLIGFFVNTLVLRADLSGNRTFAELLGSLRETALEAFAHQDLPFELLVDELAVERTLAHTPLFQVMLALQNDPAGALRIPGLTLSPIEPPATTAKFDLSLTLAESAEGFAAALELATDLFDAATAGRLLGHFANLLARAIEAPERPLADLRLMDEAEERLLHTGLNRAERTWALPVAVHDLFAWQAGRTPDRIATAGRREALTYREIDARSSALAARLRSLLPGARLDGRIGLLADPGPDVPVGMLGILKAGAGFVPVDPRHPDERLAWILEDAACEALVTQRQHLERAAGLGRRPVLCLDEAGTGGTADAAAPRDPRELRSDPGALRALAYVVYTSGSTGRPKGVQISHESLVPMLLWGCGHFGLGERTRVLQNLSFCFDFGLFEQLTTLLAGGRLVFPEEGAGDPDAFAREIIRHGIDTLHTTPVFARELAASGEVLDSLEIFHLGGEALPLDTVSRLRGAAPRAVLYNGYGPTEATIGSSVHRIDGTELQTVPIGRRSADNALYILDSGGRLVPFGVRGELHVGGIGVARGYLGRPELTAERFVPDPFGPAPGGRLYRTGDLVRYLSESGRPTGDIEFLGRIDHQVKLRGFRIELGEIETVLGSHPSVRACAVVPRASALVAYVVLETGDDGAGLRAFLEERLPGYMVPAAFVALEALPLTPNGKVDRKALPDPASAGGPLGPEQAGPRDALELQLVRIWEEVLGVPSIGVRDDFFALGGHSLLAVRVLSHIQSRLGRSLSLASLLRHPTIERLAALLREDAGPLPRTPLIELTTGAERPLFLVHPVGGEVLCYVPLARRLPHHVYGLQAVDGERSLEEMAGLYLRHVRDVQPEGPYLLGGWSLGGAVAYEMARQLESAGETVERVLLIDSFPPGPWHEEVPAEVLAASFARDAEASGLLPPGLGAAELEHRAALFATNHRAMARYQGGPCAAPLLLIRAADSIDGESDRGWGRVAGQPIEAHTLPGDHYTLLQEPAVEDLAALVQECLAQMPLSVSSGM